MIRKQEIERINELYKKSKNNVLSEDEKLEQKTLRQKYLGHIKSQVKQQLDSIEYIEDKCKDGSCNCKKH